MSIPCTTLQSRYAHHYRFCKNTFAMKKLLPLHWKVEKSTFADAPVVVVFYFNLSGRGRQLCIRWASVFFAKWTRFVHTTVVRRIAWKTSYSRYGYRIMYLYLGRNSVTKITISSVLTLHNRHVNLSLPVLEIDSSSRIRAFSASTTWPLLLNCAQYLSMSILGFTVPSSCVFSFLIDTSSGPTFSHESIASIALWSFNLNSNQRSRYY